jgi:hypothetical protein
VFVPPAPATFLGAGIKAGFPDQAVTELAEDVDQLRRPTLTAAGRLLNPQGADEIICRARGSQVAASLSWVGAGLLGVAMELDMGHTPRED